MLEWYHSIKILTTMVLMSKWLGDIVILWKTKVVYLSTRPKYFLYDCPGLVYAVTYSLHACPEQWSSDIHQSYEEWKKPAPAAPEKQRKNNDPQSNWPRFLSHNFHLHFTTGAFARQMASVTATPSSQSQPAGGPSFQQGQFRTVKVMLIPIRFKRGMSL